ncbi:MAG TPA: hypothetical protein PKV72_02055 [Candidatus Peribacteria bacterium]|nr:hypothetical protein [Candidatus Peribacteria bacterium]
MEHLPASPAGETPETLPFRNIDVLFAAYRRFEQDWQDTLEANMRVQSRRPANFPPVFASRWALAWSLRTMSDQEVLELMRTWERHPADVELGIERDPARVVADETDGVRDKVAETLTPEAVRAEGFPRAWRESA